MQKNVLIWLIKNRGFRVGKIEIYIYLYKGVVEMRSFNNILSDVHAGKEVYNQELKMSLLLS